MRPWPLPLTLVLLCPGFAQEPSGPQEGMNPYEARYGPPADVSLTDLLQEGADYDQRSVRTSGRLEPAGGLHGFALRDSFGATVRIIPVSEVAPAFASEGIRSVGQQVQVVGVFRYRRNDVPSTINFWQFSGPEEPRPKGPLKATPLSLETLVLNPGKHDGLMARVVGKFRGRNLYGDLPTKSQRSSSDWVIKDELYAVWVTGKKPRGSGWDLDANLKRDTGKWIEVAGRVETVGGVTYLRAMEVNLAQPPTPTAEAQAPSPPPERPKVAPVVVFALPLDGDQEVPPDSRFIVQFSKDMDPETFKGRIRLRYLGPPRPGERGFDGLKLSYDEGRRALLVDPGDRLRPGRQLELLLLPGIADLDGLPLTSRLENGSLDGAVDVLQYRVGT